MILWKSNHEELSNFLPQGHLLNPKIQIGLPQGRPEDEKNQQKEEASWCHSQVQDNIQTGGPPCPTEGEIKK